MLLIERRTVPEHRRKAHDAVIFAAAQCLQVLDDEPTGQQWRPTQYRPAQTQLHPGYAETALASRVMP
jgi:hypothetical protein